MIELEPETLTAAPEPVGDRRPGGSVQIPDPPAAPEELFNIAVAAINKRYQVGMMERLAIERPALTAEIARAMDRVEITWRESGPVGSPAFKLALRTWYDLKISAINYFRGAN